MSSPLLSCGNGHENRFTILFEGRKKLAPALDVRSTTLTCQEAKTIFTST
jgi:hypothetical protein